MPDNRNGLVALVAAATFVAGFGVAELTGVRALGGLALLAGGAACVRLALPVAGAVRTVALVLVALAAFVVAHPLGDEIGAWPAVLVCAAVVAGASGLLARPRA